MKKFFNILFVFSSLFVSCVHHSYSERLQTAEAVINDYPDSALKILSSINENEIVSKKDFAKFRLLKSMALDKNLIEITDVSIITPAIEYYEKQKYTDDYARALYYQGRIFQNAKQYAESALSFAKAEKYAEQCRDSQLIARIYMGIANNYSYTYNSVEALSSAEKAYDYVKKTTIGDYLDGATFNYARALANNEEIAKGVRILDSLAVCELNDTVLVNMSILYSLYYKTISHKYPIDSLKNEYQNALKRDIPFKCNDYCAYAYILGRSGENAAAESLFTQIKTTFPEGDQEAASWESDLAAANGNYEKAYRLQDKALVHQDSVLSYVLQQSLSKIQKEYFQAKLEESERIQEKKQLENVILILCFFLFVSLLLSVSYLIWHRFKKREDENKEKLEKLLITMKNIKQNKEHQILTLQNRYLSRMFRPLGDLYSRYLFSVQHGENIDSCQKKLLKAIEDIDIEEDNGWFETILNTERNNLPAQFKNDFPALKKEDYKLFCYYLAGFDATIISIIIKAPSQSAVYTRKNRLRKIISDSSVLQKETYLSVLT